MKKVTIFSLHLGYGGIEKCVTTLANILSSTYDVEIISTYKLASESAFEINDKVSVRYLIDEVKPNREEWKEALKNKKIITLIKETYKALLCLFLRRKRTIDAIKECDSDIIISTRHLFNNWVGKYAPKKTKKIAWEHNHHHGNVEYAKKIVNSCRRMDELVLVSNSLRTFYKKKMKEAGYKCKCIYIPNAIDEIPSKFSSLKSNHIISIGRFSREKGFPDLIDVFKLIHDKNSDIHLDLVGDGAQKNMIVDKIYEYGLEGRVTVHGYLSKKEINKLLSNASLYLMTSFTESFGIVLIEAMSYGIPCIAFSSAEGAYDLIDDNKNGKLINNRDKEKMAIATLELLDDDKMRQNMGIEARKSSLNYTTDVTKILWFKILK